MSCQAFTFLMENICVQFEDIVYQQKVCIPMGTNCVPLKADLFLFCYERDFMSNLHKSKQYDLIVMFNDTSRYLVDMFSVDNREFEKHILEYIYHGTSAEHSKYFRQINFFPWFEIIVNGNDVHTSVNDKRDDFGFPIFNIQWLSGDVHRLQSYGTCNILTLLDLLGCVLAFGFPCKKSANHFQTTDTGSQDSKNIGSFFRPYSELISKFDELLSQ